MRWWLAARRMVLERVCRLGRSMRRVLYMWSDREWLCERHCPDRLKRRSRALHFCRMHLGELFRCERPCLWRRLRWPGPLERRHRAQLVLDGWMRPEQYCRAYLHARPLG